MDKKNILIIDDDPGLRKTLSDILKAKGYETSVAQDGAGGLAQLKRGGFNVALVDLILPDMPGLEVLNRMKAESPSTEAIILTGNASLDSAIEATNKGAFSYLQKPYDVDQLELHIRRAVEKREAEEKIVLHARELNKINAELKALYEISLAVSRTIVLPVLLTEIVRVMSGIETFGIMGKGALFLVEEDRLRLASYTGFSEQELAPCNGLRIGPEGCLCGLTASSGEVVISRDSRNDRRHTIQGHEDAEPHGHVVIPLKAVSKIVGVLCLYLHPTVEPEDRMYEQFVTIGNQIGIAIENALHYEQAEAFSYRDPLTGLANRRLLEIEMEKGLDASRRYAKPLSIVMLDIDHFKKYNDTRGHVDGDRLLKTLAGVLLRQMRNADHVFRYGGEEFLITLPETDLEAARAVAERLRSTVEAEAGITISLGVSSYVEGATKEDLITRADSAMYRAKQQGRNRVGAWM